MENREAIEIISNYEVNGCGYCHQGGSEVAAAFNLAISALEKQEKKPAKAKFNKRYNKFVYFCPVCGEVTGKYDFCSECGQAIDYDNTEPYTEGES